MKSVKHIELNGELIKKITSYFPSKKFKSQSHLFYEGQIPISGFLIIEGAVQISQKKKHRKILASGCLFGIFELINKIPMTINAEVFPNTEVCFLDKTTLIEIFHSNESELIQTLGTIVVKQT